MAYTPTWRAAENGLPGNLEATNHAAQINQFLGAHDVTPIYAGDQIVDPGANSSANFVWLTYGNNYDIDQPFTMPSGKTAIGPVTIPVQPHGNGADLLVTLYPDNGSGDPATASPLAQTLVPAAWMVNLLASDGLESPPSVLATAQFNSLVLNDIQATSWTPPAFDQSGTASFPSYTVSGNYVIRVGGVDNSASGYSAQVSLIPYQGGNSIGMPIPSSALPQGTSQPGVAALADAVVVTGGSIASGNTNATWVAQWNPSSGSLGTWTQQANLPISAYSMGIASNPDTSTVYVIGGNTSATNLPASQSTVYWAKVANGQLGTWNAGPSYPFATWGTQAACLNGWLVAFGGDDNNRDTYSNVYYAKIAADGSLGGWNTGPSLPITWASGGFASYTTTDNEIIIVGGLTSNGASNTSLVMILPVTADGLGVWRTTNWYTAQTNQAAAFSIGSGSWELFTFEDTTYHSAQVLPVPLLSVPLPNSGLTSGSTYHVVLQQNQGADPTGYLAIGIQAGALPVSALARARFSSAWSTIDSGWSIPIAVYDQSAGGQILHAWQDPNADNLAAAAVTQIADCRGRILGICDAVALPQDPLNQKYLTTSNVSPWTASGGTLTASTAETQGGYAYSGLLTPSGSAAISYAASELMPVTGGQWYRANAWLYSTPGYSSVSLSVNWFDHAGAYLTTSSHTVSLTAATWTQVTNVFQAPAGAAQGQLVPTEGGTPPATAVLYMSDVTLIAAFPNMLPSVCAVDYSSNAPWPPTGITRLA